MFYANLIIIAYEFTQTWLNCVNLCADNWHALGGEQSLRLSTDNEQNLYNLAHCFVGGVRLSALSRKRQGGLTEYRKLSKLASWR